MTTANETSALPHKTRSSQRCWRHKPQRMWSNRRHSRAHFKRYLA